jgi:hypothetical protein
VARLFYGLGRGFRFRSGFTLGVNGGGGLPPVPAARAYTGDYIRPPFTIPETQFSRRAVSDPQWTPMPFGPEGLETFPELITRPYAPA